MEQLNYLLLIDDDEPTNYYHNILIEESGLVAKWDIVNTPTEALDTLVNNELIPDVILLDINMPKMDGWEFLDAYAQLAPNRICKYIIMLTTSLSTIDEKRGMEHPMVQSFFTKPLTEEIIQKVFAEWYNDLRFL